MSRKFRKITLAILKIAFAFAALGYVLYKADIRTIASYIAHSDPSYLLLAFIALNFGTFLGSLRLKTYFAAENMKLPESYAIVVYYIGLFFNTVLPGGIGGDGYITLHLRRRFGFPALKIVRILLAGRANGLFFLNLCFFAFAWFSSFNSHIRYLHQIILALFLLQFPVYALAARYLWKENLLTFFKAGFFSVTSQIFSLLTAYFAFKAVGISSNYIDYITLYITAAIVGIIPITPGGVGLRELIFLKGSELAGLDPHLAVAASLVYFAIYFVTSLSGLALYLFGNKLKTDKENEHGIDANPTS